MKKIIDYCDICECNYETTKCGCCGCSLCEACALNFLINIGKYERCHHKSFCKNCLSEIQLNKTKNGNNFLKETRKKILTELNKRIESVRKKGKFKCPICNSKDMIMDNLK